eukprot:jgi/Mesen1/1092/ME000123S00265
MVFFGGGRGQSLLHLVVLLLFAGAQSICAKQSATHVEKKFNIFAHLSTSTRYQDSLDEFGGPTLDLPAPPEGCTPIHLNLLARHGTRGPTLGRIKEINDLGEKLRAEVARLHAAGLQLSSPAAAAHSQAEHAPPDPLNPLKTPGHGHQSLLQEEKEKAEGGLEEDIERAGGGPEEAGRGQQQQQEQQQQQRCGSEVPYPEWIRDWESPWAGAKVGGELIQVGEREAFEIGRRTKQMFPTLFEGEYHHELYPILATQVPRASASAVAFGMGLFQGAGFLGDGRHRAFSVLTETRQQDVHLRFHDVCVAYKLAKKALKAAVHEQRRPFYADLARQVSHRHGLALEPADVGALWALCKTEASAMHVADRACALFSPPEVLLLEWLDDTEMFFLKGYGAAINYKMGVKLLQDVVGAMETAVGVAKRERGGPGNELYQRARFRYAHAETVIPFLCLLGLFKEDVQKMREAAAAAGTETQTETGASSGTATGTGMGSDKGGEGELTGEAQAERQLASEEASTERQLAEEAAEAMRRVLEGLKRHGESLPPPPMPPFPRAWRGSQVSPFAANTALALYQCRPSGPSPADDDFRVLVLHNEQPVLLPDCNGELFCPFSVFRGNVAEPHLQHSFEHTCAAANSIELPTETSHRLAFVRRAVAYVGHVPKAVGGFARHVVSYFYSPEVAKGKSSS